MRVRFGFAAEGGRRGLRTSSHPIVTESVQRDARRGLASRGLALATLGRLEEAMTLGREALRDDAGRRDAAAVRWLSRRSRLLRRTPGLLGCGQEMCRNRFRGRGGRSPRVLHTDRIRSFCRNAASSPDAPNAPLHVVSSGGRSSDIASAMGLEVCRRRLIRGPLSQSASARSTTWFARDSRTARSQSGSSSPKRRSRFMHHVFDKMASDLGRPSR